MNSNNYHFEARASLVRDSGGKDNKWTKERFCGGEYFRLGRSSVQLIEVKSTVFAEPVFWDLLSFTSQAIAGNQPSTLSRWLQRQSLTLHVVNPWGRIESIMKARSGQNDLFSFLSFIYFDSLLELFSPRPWFELNL